MSCGMSGKNNNLIKVLAENNTSWALKDVTIYQAGVSSGKMLLSGVKVMFSEANPQ